MKSEGTNLLDTKKNSKCVLVVLILLMFYMIAVHEIIFVEI